MRDDYASWNCCDTREDSDGDELTELVKAARLLKEAGHMSPDTYAATIVSIVDNHIHTS